NAQFVALILDTSLCREISQILNSYKYKMLSHKCSTHTVINVKLWRCLCHMNRIFVIYVRNRIYLVTGLRTFLFPSILVNVTLHFIILTVKLSQYPKFRSK
ncbi:hypothetical protein L9F63_016160, partial [Diploptera punctata]